VVQVQALPAPQHLAQAALVVQAAVLSSLALLPLLALLPPQAAVHSSLVHPLVQVLLTPELQLQVAVVASLAAPWICKTTRNALTSRFASLPVYSNSVLRTQEDRVCVVDEITRGFVFVCVCVWGGGLESSSCLCWKRRLARASGLQFSVAKQCMLEPGDAYKEDEKQGEGWRVEVGWRASRFALHPELRSLHNFAHW
jgi:hypothetical protein